MYYCPEPPYVERRAKNKIVTLLKDVQGNVSELLGKLKSDLGVGGTQVSARQIELQGDQTKRVKQILAKLGAAPAEEKQESQKTSEKYLRKMESYLSTRPARQEKFVIQPANAQNMELCRKLHGDFWPYCVGTCRDVDFSDFFDGLSVKAAQAPSPAIRVSDLSIDELLRSAELVPCVGAAVVRRLKGQDDEDNPTRSVTQPKPHRVPVPPPRPRVAPVSLAPKKAKAPAKPVNYVLRVRLPEDVDFGDFRLFVAAACTGVLRVRQPQRDGGDVPTLGFGERSEDEETSEAVVVFENISDLRAAKVIFDEMSCYQTREPNEDERKGVIHETTSEDSAQEEEAHEDSLLKAEQWETLRMLGLEENDFFWSKLFDLVEAGKFVDEAFADAVVECMPEEEISDSSFVAPHHLWLRLSAAEHKELGDHGMESSPEFWESFELLVLADVPDAFTQSLKLVEETVKKEERKTRKFECPVCCKKFDEELDVIRHLDKCGID